MAACVHFLEQIKTIFVKKIDKNELFIWIVSPNLLGRLFRISTAKWSCQTWGPALWKSLPDLVNFCRQCPRTDGLSHGLVLRIVLCVSQYVSYRVFFRYRPSPSRPRHFPVIYVDLWFLFSNILYVHGLNNLSKCYYIMLESIIYDIQLKLETSKSQGLANITRGIRKSTDPKVLPVIKYNMP